MFNVKALGPPVVKLAYSPLFFSTLHNLKPRAYSTKTYKGVQRRTKKKLEDHNDKAYAKYAGRLKRKIDEDDKQAAEGARKKRKMGTMNPPAVPFTGKVSRLEHCPPEKDLVQLFRLHGYLL